MVEVEPVSEYTTENFYAGLVEVGRTRITTQMILLMTPAQIRRNYGYRPVELTGTDPYIYDFVRRLYHTVAILAVPTQDISHGDTYF
jgi:hypothetical protein